MTPLDPDYVPPLGWADELLDERLRLLRLYPMVWRWRARLPERFGQRCRVTARGRLNTVRVEFPDQQIVFTSRYAVKKA